MELGKRVGMWLGAVVVLGLTLVFWSPTQAFFSDFLGHQGNNVLQGGNLGLQAVLKIDDLAGNLVDSPVLTTTNNTDSRCDDLNCNGQNQGLVNLKIEPNTIHNFSYTVTNTGTVDYENYTGDEIAAWITSDYTPEESPSFIGQLPAGVGINFDGTNYIDTGVMSSNHLTAAANVEQNCGSILALASEEYLYGVYADDSNFYVMSSTSSIGGCLAAIQTWQAAVGSGNSGDLGLNLLSDGGTATLSLTSTATTGIFTNDGVPVETCDIPVLGIGCENYFEDAQIETPASIFLGAANGSSDYFSGTVHGFSLTDTNSNEALANYQSAVRCYGETQTMSFGFWDSVTQEFIVQDVGNALTASQDLTYEQACGGEILDPGSTATPDNPMQILFFPASMDDSVIEDEVNGLLAGESTLNQTNCGLSFAGTNEGISPVCLTGILTAPITGSVDTHGLELAPKESITYNYKFVVYLPTDTPPDYSNILVNFGVSTGARGVRARNWRKQIHPFVSANTTGGSNPEINVVGNTQPFLDQLATENMSTQDYLQSLVTATDKKFGNCDFAPSGDCTVAITNDGGFDPGKVGTYNVEYTASNSYGNSAIYIVPVQVWNFSKITNGMYHGIALGTNGSVWTWGYNLYGQRGQGNDDSAADLPPVTRVDQNYFGDLPVVDIAGSYHNSCAVNSEGVIYCWGYSADGALGNGESGLTDQTTPVSVVMPEGIKFVQISGSRSSNTGARFSAVGSDGNIYVWGDAELSYRMGTGSTSDVLVPTKITNVTNDLFVQTSHGETGGVAVTASGRVWVWGMNNEGQMAFGNTTATNATTSLPHLVESLTNVKKVSYGGYGGSGFVMALKNNGTAWTWGWGIYGVLGNGSTANQSVPVQALVSNVRDINGGSDHTQFVVGNDIWGSGYNDFNETFTSGASVPMLTMSTMANVAGNVGVATSGYDNSWILSKDGKMVWGIGYSNALDLEFGNSENSAASIDEAVPWMFTPEPLLVNQN